MKIESVDEREDGSAFVKLDLSHEEVTYLLQEGFLTMLKRYLEQFEEQKKVPSLLKKE